MRFSLLTLLLVCLTAGSGIGVYTMGNAWKQVSGPISLDGAKPWMPSDFSRGRYLYRSPDQTRLIKNNPGERATICRYDNGLCIGEPLYVFPTAGSACFWDDNTVMLHDESATGNDRPRILALFRRQFVERWPGLFSRVEVWMLGLFGGLLIWNLLRPKRGKIKATAAGAEGAEGAEGMKVSLTPDS